MAYFRKYTVNPLNLHYGLHSFALSGSSAFFGVFLLKWGVPALGRFLIRPSVLIFAKRLRPNRAIEYQSRLTSRQRARQEKQLTTACDRA
jgi:hypothetical protein